MADPRARAILTAEPSPETTVVFSSRLDTTVIPASIAPNEGLLARNFAVTGRLVLNAAPHLPRPWPSCGKGNRSGSLHERPRRLPTERETRSDMRRPAAGPWALRSQVVLGPQSEQSATDFCDKAL